MAKRSVYTEAALAIVQEWRALHARPAKGIPFGHEKISHAALMQRLADMPPAERAAFLAQLPAEGA